MQLPQHKITGNIKQIAALASLFENVGIHSSNQNPEVMEFWLYVPTGSKEGEERFLLVPKGKVVTIIPGEDFFCDMTTHTSCRDHHTEDTVIFSVKKGDAELAICVQQPGPHAGAVAEVFKTLGWETTTVVANAA